VKFIPFILLITIGLLAFKPLADACFSVWPKASSCCAELCVPLTADSETSHNDCEGKLCNPLQSCSSCACVLSYFHPDLDLVPVAQTKPGIAHRPSAFCAIDFDFWQPPQHV
jgi:hypothetical protein